MASAGQLVPAFALLKCDLGTQPARIQFVIAYGVASVTSWKATVRSWVRDGGTA